MAVDVPTSPKPIMSYRRGRKAASVTHDLNTIFNQANSQQNLLRFEHDAYDIIPAVSVLQEYARAVRLLHIRARWSRLGMADWHTEMNILLCARSSMSLGLDVWGPLDDFLDTYEFEMELQPMPGSDTRTRKLVKRGLLKQLQDATTKELESCHRNLCELLGDAISNWRSLDTRLLAFKKRVWLECEKHGDICVEPMGEVSKPQGTCDITSSRKNEGVFYAVPPPSDYMSTLQACI
ncbi:hypothetical protein GQ44DRAFT_737774 [Phaeosphaeriaceae sp. PMI808]|nr:hypothetical protein GQ44DRAFT_737774 [Phaeosphaeriaceae sp. PMI808]